MSEVIPNEADPIRVQWWLAELDLHGNPKLTDGPHDERDGANHAAYLIEALRLGNQGQIFAVCQVAVYPAHPSSDGVNQEAIDIVNRGRFGTCGDEKAPPGWHCTRVKGHEGPCAAIQLPF